MDTDQPLVCGTGVGPHLWTAVAAHRVARRQSLTVDHYDSSDAPALTVLDEWEVEQIRAQPPLVLQATVRLCA